MRRYLVLVGLLCAALVVVGCEPKAKKAPGGPDVKKEAGTKEPAATPAAPEPKKASADVPDPFAGPPAAKPSPEVPKAEPPKTEKKPEAPAKEPEKKADAKK